MRERRNLSCTYLQQAMHCSLRAMIIIMMALNGSIRRVMDLELQRLLSPLGPSCSTAEQTAALLLQTESLTRSAC